MSEYLYQWSTPDSICLLYLDPIVSIVSYFESNQSYVPYHRHFHSVNTISISGKVIQGSILRLLSATTIQLQETKSHQFSQTQKSVHQDSILNVNVISQGFKFCIAYERGVTLPNTKTKFTTGVSYIVPERSKWHLVGTD